MRVLFVDDTGRARGPTAAQHFGDRAGLSTDFGGVGRGATDALTPEQIDWAELIVAMEPRQKTRLQERFGRALSGRQIAVAGVPAGYGFMQADLIEVLEEKAGPLLG